MEGSIAIIPVGAVPKSFCREIGQLVTQHTEAPCELLMGLGDPKYAYNPGREQYHSTAIVRRISQAIDKKKHVMGVGLVDVDLFMPDMNFVFGDADRDARASVVSIARLRPAWYGRPPDHALTVRRTLSEVLHEVGHISGLPHCQNDSCAMFFSNTLSDTDRKNGPFCEACRSRLDKSAA